jgi:two-component system response regulator RegX3
MPRRVLVLASDELAVALESSGMVGGALQLVCVSSFADLLGMLQEYPVAAVVIELDASAELVQELLARLRRETDLPVVAVVAEARVDTVVNVLEWGADECLEATLSPREIITHIRAQIRRSVEYNDWSRRRGALVVGPLEIDLARYEVARDGQQVALTPREFELLAYLARNAGRAVPREEIIEQVWQGEISRRSRSLDVHIGRMRAKIESDPRQPILLTTVPGVGYRLEA